MFAVLSFLGTAFPMFFVNLWIDPNSAKYTTAVLENCFQDLWRYSYLFYVIVYGIPLVMTPLTYAWDDAQLRRLYEAWYGEWFVILMFFVVALQIFFFLPTGMYNDDFPWEGMFVYIGVYVLHVVIWLIFRNDHFRWAYGIPPEVIERDDFHYCCK